MKRVIRKGGGKENKRRIKGEPINEGPVGSTAQRETPAKRVVENKVKRMAEEMESLVKSWREGKLTRMYYRHEMENILQNLANFTRKELLALYVELRKRGVLITTRKDLRKEELQQDLKEERKRLKKAQLIFAGGTLAVLLSGGMAISINSAALVVISMFFSLIPLNLSDKIPLHHKIIHKMKQTQQLISFAKGNISTTKNLQRIDTGVDFSIEGKHPVEIAYENNNVEAMRLLLALSIPGINYRRYLDTYLSKRKAEEEKIEAENRKRQERLKINESLTDAFNSALASKEYDKALEIAEVIGVEVKDREGNTLMHHAAMISGVSSFTEMERFIKKMEELGFRLDGPENNLGLTPADYLDEEFKKLSSLERVAKVRVEESEVVEDNEMVEEEENEGKAERKGEVSTL